MKEFLLKHSIKNCTDQLKVNKLKWLDSLLSGMEEFLTLSLSCIISTWSLRKLRLYELRIEHLPVVLPIYEVESLIKSQSISKKIRNKKDGRASFKIH